MRISKSKLKNIQMANYEAAIRYDLCAYAKANHPDKPEVVIRLYKIASFSLWDSFAANDSVAQAVQTIIDIYNQHGSN